MKFLTIDSSGLTASVAVVTEEAVLAEYTLNYKKTHSQTLLPMIDQMQHMLELPPEEIDAIVVAKGPGSFTGLRIGSATAKGLAMAWDKPIVPVPTVDALAYQIYGWDGLICPMMDARRQQVYTGLYRHDKGGFCVIEGQQAAAAADMAHRINELGMQVILLGDGIPVNMDTLEKELTVPYTVAPAFSGRQRGAALGMLGTVYWKQGIVETAAEHKPEYLRLPQAERERLEKLHGNS